MRSSTPEKAGEIVVEAATASKALEEVSTRLGPRATILEASKVTRGGIGGFFAREMVQLRAEPPGPGAAGGEHGGHGLAATDQAEDLTPLQRGSVTTTAGGQTALDRLLDELSSEVNQREETFGDTLRRHLAGGAAGGAGDQTAVAAVAPAPLAAAAAPAPRPEPAPPAPAPLADDSMGFDSALAAVRLSGAGSTPGAAPGAGAQVADPAGTPAVLAARPGGHLAPPSAATLWAGDRLVRLGVPAALLEGWQDPASDLEGLVAFAQRLAPLCGPLPAGAALLAGPRAQRLAVALGAARAEAGEPLPAAGPVCARVRDSARGRAWLAASRHGRWLHLVVGGAGWQRLLLDYPLAVSWCGGSALPDALRVATELALPLGYGCAGGRGSAVVQASPVEVAVGIRDLLVHR